MDESTENPHESLCDLSVCVRKGRRGNGRRRKREETAVRVLRPHAAGKPKL